MKTKQKQQGVALITAILITAVATVAAVALMSRQFIDVRRTANMMNYDQAYLFALAVEDQVKELIQANTASQSYDDKQYLDLINTQFATGFVFEGVTVTGELIDLESKFNINSIYSKPGTTPGTTVWDEVYVGMLRNILQQVIRDVGVSADAEGLINAVKDWIDADDNTSFPGGGEDPDYLAHERPYRAANRMLTSVSELHLIQGFSRELLFGKPATEDRERVPGLLDYVTVLPFNETMLNVNLITAKELQFLPAGGWDEAMINNALNDRPFKADGKIDEHVAFKEIKSPTPAGNNGALTDEQKRKQDEFTQAMGKLDIQSSYWLMKINCTLDNVVVRLNSLVQRTGSERELLTISRAIGTDGV